MDCSTKSSLDISAAFKWCIVTRCLADADLSDAAVTTLRAQKEPGQIIYKNSAQADVSIPVSFRGFAAAIGALEKK
jgi:invasion protein IalB